MILFPVMIYAPIVSQRRMAEGFWVCLVVAMVSLFDRSSIPPGVRITWSVLFPTTIFLMIGSITQVLVPREPIFRSAEEVQAIQALSRVAQQDAGVLSSFEVGNNLPARIPVRSVIGHGPESVGLAELQDQLDGFFNDPGNKIECDVFFESIGADFLFWGPAESEVWSADPGSLDCAFEFYNQNGYRLFQISQ
jgi:hypothetical protein